MDIQTLSSFFMWCTIINASVISFWFAIYALAPEFIYRIHSRWSSISREHFRLLVFGFIGIFKIFVLVFNFVPFLALKIIA